MKKRSPLTCDKHSLSMQFSLLVIALVRRTLEIELSVKSRILSWAHELFPRKEQSKLFSYPVHNAATHNFRFAHHLQHKLSRHSQGQDHYISWFCCVFQYHRTRYRHPSWTTCPSDHQLVLKSIKNVFLHYVLCTILVAITYKFQAWRNFRLLLLYTLLDPFVFKNEC